MATELVPLQEDIRTEVVPLFEEQNTAVVEDDKRLALAETQVATALASGEDPEVAYDNAIGSGKLETQQNDWMLNTTNNRVKAISLDSRNKEESLITQDILRLQGNVSIGTVDSMSGEEVRTLPNGRNLTQQQITKESAKAAIRHNLSTNGSEWVDSTLGDQFLLVGGTMVPERESIDIAQVGKAKGYVTDNVEFSSIVTRDTSFIRKYRNMYFSLPLEERADDLQATIEILNEIEDNALIRQFVVDALHGPTFSDEKYRDLFNALDATVALDVIAIGGFVGKTLIRGGIALNRAKRVRDVIANVRTAEAIKESPEVMSKTGHRMADGVDSVDITTPESVRIAVVGENKTLVAEVTHELDKADAVKNVILSELTKRGVQSPAEQRLFIKQTEILFRENPNIASGSFKINSKDAHGFNVSYSEGTIGKTGDLVAVKKKQERINFTTEGVKGLSSAEREYKDNYLRLDVRSRLTGKLRNAFGSLVERLSPEQAIVSKALTKSFALSRKGLRKGDKATIDQVLRMGSKNFKEYTIDELTTAGAGKGIEDIVMTDKQVKGYYGYRNAMDGLRVLNNDSFVDTLVIRDLIVAKNGRFNVPAKEYKNADEAWAFMNNQKKGKDDSSDILVVGKSFADEVDENGLMAGYTNLNQVPFETIQNWYQKGFKLVKADSLSNLFTKGQTIKTQYALVRKANIKSPRYIDETGKVHNMMLLSKIEGYIPRSRTNGNFFIKAKRNIGLTGNKNAKARVTMAFSDNLFDADKHAEKLRLENPGVDIKVVPDRGMTAGDTYYDSVQLSGSLYSGKRKSTELLFVGEEGKGTYASPMEAIQGYINHIGRNHPIGMVRIGMRLRALDTANKLIASNDKPFKRLSDLIDKPNSLGMNLKQKHLLEDLYNQMAYISNLPTQAEREFSERVRMFATSMEGGRISKLKGFENVPRILHNMAGRGVQPVDQLRSLTFMHFLGLWNPSQYLIQASATVAAFSINPVLWGKALPRTFGMHSLDMLEDPAPVLKWMRSKEGGMAEFADAYELWAKSGLKEDILNSNANYVNTFLRNEPIEKGILAKIGESHLFFYQAGELTQTRQAWSLALEWKLAKMRKENPGKNITFKDIIGNKVREDAVLERMELYRLNMGRGNQSRLNQGAKAIPFQFKQVIAKYYSKVLPKNFGGTDELTAAEKFRLGAVPTAFFGTASVPLLNPIAAEMMILAGVNPLDVDEDVATGFQFGAFGLWLKNGMQMNVEASSRLAMGSPVFQDLYKAFMQGQPFWKAFGPSGSMGKTVWNNIQFVSKAADMYTDIEETTTIQEDMQAGLFILKDALVSLGTTSRNINDYIAYTFIDNPALKKNGAYIIDLEDFNLGTNLGMMAGFQNLQVTENYEAAAKLRAIQGGVSLVGDFHINEAKLLARILSMALNTDSEKTKRIHALMSQAIIKNRTQSEWVPLFKKVDGIMSDPKLVENKTYRDLKLTLDSRVNGGVNQFNSRMSHAAADIRGRE